MSSRRGFCPRCGAGVDPSAGFPAPEPRAARQAGLCRDCYFADFDLVSLPEEITVRICLSCGSVNRDGDWEDVGDKDYTDVAIEAISDAIGVHRDATNVSWEVEPVQHGANELALHCTVAALVHGEQVTEEHVVTAFIARETCSRCGRIAGDHYAATIQVRAMDRQPSQDESDRAVALAHAVVEDMAADGNREAYVTEVIDRPEGVDIRVSTTSIGAKISKRIIETLGGTYDASERLITEDGDGRRVYRVAFAVRLPPYRAGDIVEGANGPMLVEGGYEQLTATKLATGETVRVLIDELEDAEIVATVADATETTVVTIEDEHAVQLLDPDTYEATSVPRPSGMTSDQSSVDVVRTSSGLYILPEEASAV